MTAELISLGATLAFGLLYCEIAAQLAGVYQRKNGRIHISEIIGIVMLWLPIAVVAVFRAIFHVIRRGG